MQESVVHKKERPLILETWRKHPVSKKVQKYLFYLYIIIPTELLYIKKTKNAYIYVCI